MNHEVSAYSLWSLAIINSAVFILYASSFAKPRGLRDWRSSTLDRETTPWTGRSVNFPATGDIDEQS
jgi:hypothetical protein